MSLFVMNLPSSLVLIRLLITLPGPGVYHTPDNAGVPLPEGPVAIRHAPSQEGPVAIRHVPSAEGPVAIRHAPSAEGLRIMWYNVENLFHPSDDPGIPDEEFTMVGVRRWSMARYREKLVALCKVIVAAGRWEPPDLIGLCEVENRQVVEDLAGHPILKRFGYECIHFDSPDERGIDVACLYRGERFRLVSCRAIHSAANLSEGTATRATRDVLLVTGDWGGGDTIDLLLVHLISRYRGAAVSSGPRKIQVRQLVHLADSLLMHRNKGLCILAGDFNDEYGSWSMAPLESGTTGKSTLFRVECTGSPGSYKYRGAWSFLDHFFVAGETENCVLRGLVFSVPAMMTVDEVYGGMKPWRTYEGYRYSGGISDHLPLLLDIIPLPSSDPSGP